jgi:hypothetical protein
VVAVDIRVAAVAGRAGAEAPAAAAHRADGE